MELLVYACDAARVEGRIEEARYSWAIQNSRLQVLSRRMRLGSCERCLILVIRITTKQRYIYIKAAHYVQAPDNTESFSFRSSG